MAGPRYYQSTASPPQVPAATAAPVVVPECVSPHSTSARRPQQPQNFDTPFPNVRTPAVPAAVSPESVGGRVRPQFPDAAPPPFAAASSPFWDVQTPRIFAPAGRPQFAPDVPFPAASVPQGWAAVIPDSFRRPIPTPGDVLNPLQSQQPARPWGWATESSQPPTKAARLAGEVAYQPVVYQAPPNTTQGGAVYAPLWTRRLVPAQPDSWAYYGPAPTVRGEVRQAVWLALWPDGWAAANTDGWLAGQPPPGGWLAQDS